MPIRLCTLILGILSAVGVMADARAQSCTICICSASVTSSVNFGSYNAAAPTDTDTVGTIAFSCLALVSPRTVGITVSLSTGRAGTYTPRNMQLGATNTLNYNLYTTTARNVIWGNGTGGTSTFSESATVVPILGLSRNYNVFGRIPRGQYVAAGTYADSVVVTISF